jgi:hypothetical protein
MQHESWCDTRYHEVPPDEAAAEGQGPCIGPMGAQVDQVAAYLRSSPVGTTAVMCGKDGAALPVQRYAEYCLKGLLLAIEGGAILPAGFPWPRPAG